MTGQIPARLITADHIRDIMRAMARKGLKPTTINGLRGGLFTVFSTAPKKLWTGANPVREVKSLKVPKTIPWTLKAEELSVALAQMPPAWRPVTTVAVYTGLRKGELLGLQKRDIDLQRRELTVRRSYDQDTTKGKREAIIPHP